MKKLSHHIKPVLSGAVLALALTVTSPRANAGTVTLDFNNGTASNAVGSDFAACGIVFKALTPIDPSPPEYGRLNAGMPAMPTMGVVDTGASGNLPPSDPNADRFNILATFSVPVDSVSMEVWNFLFSDPAVVVTLTALDANNAVLGSTTVGPSNPVGFNGFKGIATISGVGTIKSFLLTVPLVFSDTMGIDNLTFHFVGVADISGDYKTDITNVQSQISALLSNSACNSGKLNQALGKLNTSVTALNTVAGSCGFSNQVNVAMNNVKDAINALSQAGCNTTAIQQQLANSTRNALSRWIDLAQGQVGATDTRVINAKSKRAQGDVKLSQPDYQQAVDFYKQSSDQLMQIFPGPCPTC